MKRYTSMGSRGLPLIAGLALMMIALPAILAAQEGLGRAGSAALSRTSPGPPSKGDRRHRDPGRGRAVRGEIGQEGSLRRRGPRHRHLEVHSLERRLRRRRPDARGPAAPGERSGGARPEEGDPGRSPPVGHGGAGSHRQGNALAADGSSMRPSRSTTSSSSSTRTSIRSVSTSLPPA